MATKKSAAEIEFKANTADFQKGIKEMNAAIKTASNELRLNATQMKGAGESAELLSQRQSVLKRELEAATDKVKLNEQALAEAERLLGTNSKEYQNLSNAVLQAKNQQAAIQNELTQTTSKLEQLENENKQAATSFGQLTDKISKQENDLEQLKRAYAESAVNKGKDADETKALAREIEQLSTELKQNRDKISDAESAADKFDKTLEDTDKTLDDTADSAEKTSRSFDGLKSAFSAIGKTVAAAGTAAVAAGGALVKMSVDGAAYADNVLTLSTQTGIATDKLQEYQYAAELVDVSTETLTKSMAKNIKSMSSAATGTGATAEAYKKLGVSVTDSNGNLRDGETVYWELIDSLGNVKNETERDALAMQVLGKSAQELNPLIEAGGQKMEELAGKAQEAGYVLNNETLEAFGNFDDQIQYLKVGAEGAKNALGTVLLPTLTELATDGVSLLGEFTNGIKNAGGDAGKIGETIGNTLNSIASKVNKFLPKALTLGTQLIVSVATGITQNAPDLINAILGALPLLLNGIGQVSNAIILALPQIVNSIMSALPTLLPQVITGVISLIVMLCNNFSQIIQPIIDNLPLIITSVVTALIENLPALINGVIQLALGIVGAADQIIQTLVPMIPTIIVQIVAAIITEIPTILAGVWELIEALVNLVSDWYASWIEGYAAAFGKIIEKVKTFFTDLIGKIKEKLEDIKNNVKEKFEAVKNAASEKIQAAKDKVLQIFTNIKTGIKEKVDSIKTSVTDTFNKIKDAITKPVQDAKDKVSQIVEKLKSAFNFKWSLPSLKLPHISVTGGKAPFGIGGKGSLPKFSIQWYAKGGLFEQPTILPTLDGLKGFGEAGKEYALPLNERSLTPLADMLTKLQLNNGGFADIIASRIDAAFDRLISRIERLEFAFNMDGERFATAQAGYNDSISGSRAELIERGLSL